MIFLKFYILFAVVIFSITGYSQNDTIDFSGKKYVGYENEITSAYPFKPGVIDFIDKNKVSITPSYYCYGCHVMCEGCSFRYCYPEEIYQDTPTYQFSKDTLWLTSMFTPDYLSKQKLKINTCKWMPYTYQVPLSILWPENEEASINAKLKKEKDTVIIKLEFDSLLFVNSKNGFLQFFINDKIYKSYIPKINGEYPLYGNFIDNVKDTVHIKIRYATLIKGEILTIEEIFNI